MATSPVLVVDLGSLLFRRRGDTLIASLPSGQVVASTRVDPEEELSDRGLIFKLLDSGASYARVTVDSSEGPVSARVAWYNPFTFSVTCGGVDQEQHHVFRFNDPWLLDSCGTVAWWDPAGVLHWVGSSGQHQLVAAPCVPTLEVVESDVAAHLL